ncbi:MAG: glycoside hydrolase family protein [Muribaculum sp.]|nr:glycoside hydrolase family protein [Muribaculum sp.]
MKHLILWISMAMMSVALMIPGAHNADSAALPGAEPQTDYFETAIEIIKKYEGLHSPRHWPLVGYGHKVLPGEKFSRSRALSEKEADALLRKDFQKFCKLFRSYGKDSIIMAALAYNIGNGAAERSAVASRLRAGNRDIRDLYLAHSRYRGKTLSQLKKRRIEEFDKLFIKDEIEIADIPSILNSDKL